MRVAATTAILLLGLSAAGLTRQEQPATQNTRTYEARCGSCHGATMEGGSAGPILTYVRYHSDAELTARLPVAHTGANGLQVSADDLKKVLKDMRILAGTDPDMATGGFTGIGRLRGGTGAAAP